MSDDVRPVPESRGVRTATTPLDVVFRHLALVAVAGTGPNVDSTLASGFRLHVDDLATDGAGYLALIAARWAAEGPRPPLDVSNQTHDGPWVTVAIPPRSVAHFRVSDGLIAELWMTSDSRRWIEWARAGLLW